MSTPSSEVPRRELEFREERSGFSLILKRNCSISPAGLLRVFVALALVVLAIGAGLAVAGAWPVLPFAGLEVLLLGAAFVTRSTQDRRAYAWSGTDGAAGGWCCAA